MNKHRYPPHDQTEYQFPARWTRLEDGDLFNAFHMVTAVVKHGGNPWEIGVNTGVLLSLSSYGKGYKTITIPGRVIGVIPAEANEIPAIDIYVDLVEAGQWGHSTVLVQADLDGEDGQVIDLNGPSALEDFIDGVSIGIEALPVVLERNIYPTGGPDDDNAE